MQSNTAGYPEAETGQAYPPPETSPAQSATIFAVLVMQVALLILGIMLYRVKSGPDSEMSQDDSTDQKPPAPAVAGDADQKPRPAVRQDGARSPSRRPRSRSSGRVWRQLARTAEELKARSDKAEKTVTRLETATGTLAKLDIINDKTLEKVVNALSEAGKLKGSIDHLESMITPMSRRDSAKSDVIVIAYETGSQRIIPLLPAYKAAIYDNPSRSWFKNHRVGFWVAQGQSLNPVLPHTLGLDALRTKWAEYENSDKTISPHVKPTLTELATKVLESFDANQLATTRFVLVVPADADAPAEGAWGKACVNVVLVAAQHDTPVKVNDWVNFCSGRGLLSLLRRHGPTLSAPDRRQ